MKVLLIGGTGVISTAVCEHAIELQYKVYIVNRRKRKENINKSASLIIADIKKDTAEDLIAKFGTLKYDVVVDFLSYDVKQLRKMLSIVNCEQYIFISSATVYDERDDEKAYSESDIKGNRGWEYCLKKYDCELELKKIALEKHLKYTIVRPYVTYSKNRFPYQFSPVEYYTIIDRIIRERPIPLCENKYTTVTDSRDFAVGIVGLFGNDKAFNEDFHITSDNLTSWRHIAEILAKKYKVKLNTVKIDKEIISNFRNSIIDTDEIIYDKARNMKFDNSKIKNVVSGFEARRKIDDSITDICEFFEEDKNRRINYLWAGCLDRFLRGYVGKKSGKYKFNSFADRMKYDIGYSSILCRGYLVLKKIRNIIKD